MTPDRRKAYYYRWPDEHRKMTGIALDVHVHTDPKWGPELRFDETGHPHMIEGEIVRETEDGFIFRSDGAFRGEWEFRELTIEDFRRFAYRYVEGGDIIAAKIHTTEDLHEWYRKTFHFPNQ